MMYERDKLFLLEDFCGYVIDLNESIDRLTNQQWCELIDNFIGNLKSEIAKPYVIAMLDDCEIENYLQKIFIDLEITKK